MVEFKGRLLVLIRQSLWWRVVQQFNSNQFYNGKRGRLSEVVGLPVIKEKSCFRHPKACCQMTKRKR